MNWTSGYVSEIDYTYGYYGELNPSKLRLACLSENIAPPSADPLRYLELGYGQGMSINIHAAAFAGEFWGTDFNPTQAAHARSLADAAGSGAILLDDSFAELAARSDLPEFDIIGLHGVWSWISDDNRRTIVDIIRRKLRVGGIVYNSYNCLPGWAPAMPLRHLMTLHADLVGSDATGMVGKIEGAVGFAKQVVDSGALYFRANPAVGERLKAISGLNRSYLAHEFFNRDWQVMPFSEVARWLDDAKVSFVASANLLDHVEAVNLTTEGLKLLADIRHPILRQSVRDYFINQQFRRDVFVKGPCRLSRLSQMEALKSQAFVLTSHPDDIPMKVKGALREATLQEAMYRPVIEVLADENYAPKTMGQMSGHARLKSLNFSQLFEVLTVLSGVNHVHPAQQASKESRQRCTALNRHICDRARDNADIAYLASPVTGSGIPVERYLQLFLLAAQHGKKTIAEQAAFAWECISTQGKFLIKDGKKLETADESIAELKEKAAAFGEKRRPILKALGIE
jgi:Predicted methyltransferase regulatory domain/Methyltransferase domain